MTTSGGRASSLWRRMWERAPRQLRFTSSGRVLVGLALAVGFAAVNTGNNLLFLGWGLVLSAILLSGVLSEAVLRNLAAQAEVAPLAPRARETTALPLQVRNVSRLQAAFALELSAVVRGPTATCIAPAPFVLRLRPSQRLETHATLMPLERGRHVLEVVRASTSYPFGFFAKSRRFRPPSTVEFWVAPAAVPVQAYLAAIDSAAGESPEVRAGSGEDFHELRSYRHGDDLRRVCWRRSAKTGRWVVREQEAAARGAILVELALTGPVAPTAANVEQAIRVAGSL